MHLDDYDPEYDDWDSNSHSDAQQLLASIPRFDFIVIFVAMYFYLSHLSAVTVELQGRAVDIIVAYQMISVVKDLYKKERADVEKGLRRCTRKH